jgi:hypothetical protein
LPPLFPLLVSAICKVREENDYALRLYENRIEKIERWEMRRRGRNQQKTTPAATIGSEKRTRDPIVAPLVPPLDPPLPLAFCAVETVDTAVAVPLADELACVQVGSVLVGSMSFEMLGMSVPESLFLRRRVEGSALPSGEKLSKRRTNQIEVMT